jgi:hypothetical protein
MSNDDISNAALKIVWPLPSCSKSWIGGTVEQCEFAQKRLIERRKEFETLAPPWMRKAVMHWFDFSQREINEAMEDCRTNKSRRERDEYQKRRSEEQDRAQQILRSIGR